VKARCASVYCSLACFSTGSLSETTSIILKHIREVLNLEMLFFGRKARSYLRISFVDPIANSVSKDCHR
jgi:hypothetical protein